MNNTVESGQWDSDQESGRVPISILSGFLGSGKTTLLNQLMQQPDFRRTLVIVNEFGEIGLDHDLMLHSAEDVVVEMSNGCFCCSLRRDLAKTLREVPHRFARDGKRWFDRVVIETAGIADPSPIINTLMSDEKLVELYRLDGVLITVDAVNGNQTLDEQIEGARQAAVADRLLITKADLVDTETLSRLQSRLRLLNPAAPQLLVDHGTVDQPLFNIGLHDPAMKTANVQNWLKAEAYETGQDPEDAGLAKRHASEIQTVCLTLDEPVHQDALELWLDTLSGLKSADFLRMKGIINVQGADGPTIVHGVQHVFHPVTRLKQWPSDDRQTRIVFITRNIDAATLRETLNVLKSFSFEMEHSDPSVYT